MKKFFVYLCLIVFSLITFSQVVYAVDYGKWLYTKSLKVYVEPNSRRCDMMKRAFAEWERKTQNRFSFVFVDNPKFAKIDVYFVDVIPDADREIGLTRMRTLKSGKLVQAEVFIADKSVDGKVLGHNSVYTVMLHEIGHALGIKVHSDNPLSIMYPYENDAQEILKSDIQTLAEIYDWK